MLIDCHAHICDIKDYVPDREVIPIATGYSHSTNIKTIEIAEKFCLPFAIGIAPQVVMRNRLVDVERWVEFVKDNCGEVIGEVGVDFHWPRSAEERDKQIPVFEEFVSFAQERRKALVVHSRKAEEKVVEILKERGFGRFVMHFYDGDVKLARKIIDLGGVISVPPVRSSRRKKVIRDTEIEHLVVETDCPYVGRSPIDVKESVSYIAEIKETSTLEVEEQINKNAIEFFKLELK